uniref:winged helix-turn-helix domain-containing protein n=1 Tax=Eggerthella sinensis TaxID=242230 RepID=UPI00266DD44C
MEEKTTLFAYVYWSIQQDIVAGVLPHGSALPSLRQLAARYHVGMRTARDVMAALREDGYIETHECRRATVRYGDGASDEAAQAAAALLARRATIEQSLDTMALVMPAAFAACAA